MGRCRLCGPAGSGLGLCPLPRRVRGSRRRRPKRTASSLPPRAPAGKVRAVLTSPAPAGSPCPSAFTCPQLRAGRSLPGAVENFGALLVLPLSPSSSSLVTGVNTACFAQVGGRQRPECAASSGPRSKRILNIPTGEGDDPKAHAPLPERTFSAPFLHSSRNNLSPLQIAFGKSDPYSFIAQFGRC